MNGGDVDLHIQIKFSVINIVERGEGDAFSLLYPIKMNPICGCHGNNIRRILGKMSALKRGVVALHIHIIFVNL